MRGQVLHRASQKQKSKVTEAYVGMESKQKEASRKGEGRGGAELK